LSTTTKPTDFTAMSRLSADIDLLADGKATGFVRVPHSVHRSAYGWIPIPIVRIKNGDGPSVLMQAGTHGDEWEGQIGLGNLLRALEPKDIKGRLIILPSANFPAAMAGQRTSPIDEGNLNRLYPGDAEGTITQQIAYWIEHALLPGFDYSFDFHSGGSSLTYIPSALAPRHEDPARMQKIIGMLKAFGAPVSYIAAAPQGGGRTFTSASARQGVVSMGTELGGGGLVTPASLKVAEDGMRRVLAHIGLLQGPVPAASPTRLTEIGGDDYYVYASDGGLFEPLVDLGAEVKAGQPAARIHFHHTPWREPDRLTFKRDGLVLCKRVPARCERGDCLFHLATDIDG
jgi:predicted deacylase